MKKFIKNSLLALLVICFVLNLVNLAGLIVERFTILPQVIEAAEQYSKEGITKEESYQVLASFYGSGYGNKFENQISILVLSLVLGMVIGLIFTFEKKSKIKFILSYIVGLVLISVVITLFYMPEEIISFFNEILYNIQMIWKWYTALFVIIYAIRIYISNKDVKKLNEILNKKVK